MQQFRDQHASMKLYDHLACRCQRAVMSEPPVDCQSHRQLPSHARVNSAVAFVVTVGSSNRSNARPAFCCLARPAEVDSSYLEQLASLAQSATPINRVSVRHGAMFCKP